MLKTSIAAPDIIPSFNAFARSNSFIIPPLATLIIFAEGFIAIKRSKLKRSFVSSFRGICSEMKSDCFTKSSKLIIEIFPSEKKSWLINGS